MIQRQESPVLVIRLGFFVVKVGKLNSFKNAFKLSTFINLYF